jgi:hypothetical protein
VHGNTSGGTGVVGPYGGGEPWLEEGAGTPNVFYGDMGPNSVDHTHSFTTAGSGTGIAVATSIASSGSSATNANLQPYVVVYMWNRTA